MFENIRIVTLIVGLLVGMRCDGRFVNGQEHEFETSGFSKDKIVLGLELDSLEFEYASYGYREDLPDGAFLLRKVATTSDGKFYHLNTHGADSLRPEDDLLRFEARVNGGQWKSIGVVNRISFGGTLEPNDPLPGSIGWDEYLLGTGIWIASSRPALQHDSYLISLREIANSDRYDIDASSVLQIRGHHCFCLRAHNGLDMLWFAKIHNNWVLIRRELKNAEGLPFVTYDFDSFKYLDPLVFPFQMTLTRYYGTEKQNQIVFKVLNAKVNDVDDKLFEIPTLPGEFAILQGEIDLRKQITPGGLEHLDNLCDWCHRTGYSVKPVQSNPSWKIPLIVASVAFGTFISVWFVGRRNEVISGVENDCENP